jgi:hypothetical protein
MRTALLLAAVLGVFGTGCGGCVDDKTAPAPAANVPTVNATVRKVSNMRLAIDGGAGFGDPAASADH